MNEPRPKPICKFCVHFRDRMSRQECLNDTVNMKYAPYLVDGVTFKSCLEERHDVASLCGQAGKLFKALDQKDIPVRLVAPRSTHR